MSDGVPDLNGDQVWQWIVWHAEANFLNTGPQASVQRKCNVSPCTGQGRCVEFPYDFTWVRGGLLILAYSAPIEL